MSAYKQFNEYLKSINANYDIGMQDALAGLKGGTAGLTRDQTQSLIHQDMMANTQYQRSVQDMQAAGLNPALMYDSAGSPAPVSSTPSSNMAQRYDTIMQAMMLPAQLSEMYANIKSARAQANLSNAQAANVAQDTKNKEVSEEQMRLNLQFDRDLYNTRKESAELAKEEQKANIAIKQETRNEILANIKKVHEETKSETFKQMLMDSEKRFNEAKSYEIYALVPYHQNLMSAQSQQARAAASLSTVQAAIQQGLFDNGYVEREIRNLDAEFKKTLNTTQYEQVRTELMRIQKDIQSGKAIDTSSIPDWRFTDKLAAEAWNSFIERMYEASQAITGPLAGILK